jgi:hypothetical protein
VNAYDDLLRKLQDGEEVEAIMFGNWGWGDDENIQAVPEDKKGVVLTLEQARPYMNGWSFNGGYGSPECYATYIWTNRRVLWVTQYDGATGLSSAPRNPPSGAPWSRHTLPSMPGG